MRDVEDRRYLNKGLQAVLCESLREAIEAQPTQDLDQGFDWVLNEIKKYDLGHKVKEDALACIHDPFVEAYQGK